MKEEVKTKIEAWMFVRGAWVGADDVHYRCGEDVIITKEILEELMAEGRIIGRWVTNPFNSDAENRSYCYPFDGVKKSS